MGAAVHRLARLDDASRLFEIRRKSIVELAPPAISIGEAEAWATTLTLSGMERKLRELEIWLPSWAVWWSDGGPFAATTSKGCTQPPNTPARASVQHYWIGSKD
jgi:hypothetical protein